MFELQSDVPGVNLVVDNQHAPSETRIYSVSDKTPDDKSLLCRVNGTPQSAGLSLEAYVGKGGKAVVLKSANPKLVYFLLPGAKFKQGDFECSLPGDAIQPGSQAGTVRDTYQASPSDRLTSQAMILGAGLGTRIEPLTSRSLRSKPSLPLDGEYTVISRLAALLAAQNFQSIIVNTFYMRESVKDTLNQVQGITIHYIDEDKPSGTAGGLRKVVESPEQYGNALDFSQPILIVQGDAVTNVDFRYLLQQHARNQAVVTIGCQTVADEDVNKFGILATDRSGEDGVSGRIQAFMEKPSMEQAGEHRLGSTGFYVLSPEAYPILMDVYRAKMAKATGASEIDIDFANDLFPALLAKSQQDSSRCWLWSQQMNGYWSDIGNPTQYVRTMRELYEGRLFDAMPDFLDDFYQNGVLYWPGTQQLVLAQGIELQGNVIVGSPYGI